MFRRGDLTSYRGKVDVVFETAETVLHAFWDPESARPVAHDPVPRAQAPSLEPEERDIQASFVKKWEGRESLFWCNYPRYSRG